MMTSLKEKDAKWTETCGPELANHEASRIIGIATSHSDKGSAI